MATSASHDLTLPRRIRSLLGALRLRIRAYVLLEGLAVSLVWLGITFWAGLALDYLPILVGASELPREARVALLAVIGAVLAWILYRWILRRSTVPLGDGSLALLLERRFSTFRDSLVTVVELSRRPEHATSFHAGMLRSTQEEALSRLTQVRLGRIFKWSPLLLRVAAAAGLAGSIGLLATGAPDVFRLWTSRLYLLQDEPWPRSARVEVVGVRVLRGEDQSTPLGASQITPFVDQKLKVAKGSNVQLIARASTEARVVPDYCVVHYRSVEGPRGHVEMVDYRSAEGAREYTFQNSPFKSMRASLDFDLVGYDHRVRGYEIEVVPSPAVIETRIDATFPAYIDRLPLEGEEWVKGMKLPRGTRLRLVMETNKPLTKVVIQKGGSTAGGAEIPGSSGTSATADAETIDIAGEATSFSYELANLDADFAIEVSLLDTDGIPSERPHHVRIEAVADHAPEVDSLLAGIGTAVTPDAVIPLRGTVVDDYGVARTWFEIYLDGEPHKQLASRIRQGKIEDQVDLREERAKEKGLEVHAGQKLVLEVQAEDRCDLAGQPKNVGHGSPHELDVVTPDDLLRILEREELGLRQRFELIHEEMGETRDTIARVHRSFIGKSEPVADEPEDAAGGNDTGRDARGSDGTGTAAAKKTPEQKAAAFRELHAQRAHPRVEKSAGETLGVAFAFERIREELINNRVIDSEDRKLRLQEQIARPLREIAEQLLPELMETLKQLERQIADTPSGTAIAQKALDQSNEVLARMDAVLEKMLDLETFNELVDLVRGILEDQDKLMDDTKTLRKTQLLEDLIKPKP